MELFYESAKGEKINLNADPIFVVNPESLLGNEWNVELIGTMSNVSRIKRIYREAKEYPLKISVLADDSKEFNKIMQKINRVFESDVENNTPGKIFWNGSYKKVLVIATKYSAYDEHMESTDCEYTVIALNTRWIDVRSIDLNLSLFDDIDKTDYPLTYPYGYRTGGVNDIPMEIDTAYAIDFIATLTGSCENPEFAIAGHTYRVLTDLSDGERVVIDTKEKTITHFYCDGSTENIFHLRDRDSYIFEKIPSEGGKVNLINCSLSLLEFVERGEPVWT